MSMSLGDSCGISRIRLPGQLAFLHCITEISIYWVETKPSEIDNPRRDYQTA